MICNHRRTGQHLELNPSNLEVEGEWDVTEVGRSEM